MISLASATHPVSVIFCWESLMPSLGRLRVVSAPMVTYGCQPSQRSAA